MKRIKKVLVGLLSLVGLAVLLIALAFAELRREIASDRRRAERAVSTTVENIAKLGQRQMSTEVLTNTAVFPASVHVISTSPIVFRVEATTAWPDWMIYEYDSRTPVQGVHHYLF